MNDEIESLLRGSIDLDVHAAPDIPKRRMDALETTRAAYEAGMGGFVLKSDNYLTYPLTYALSQMYPGLEIYGSISLNSPVGGINPEAVETAARLGTKVVWMPTISAAFHLPKSNSGNGLNILDKSEKLTDDIFEIIDIVQGNDMVLASGYISPLETIKLFGAAKDHGVRKMIVTHPEELLEDQLKNLTTLGAYMEYSFLSCMPLTAKISPMSFSQQILKAGIERSVVTTAFGQPVNPPPSEGMRMAIAALLDSGMSPKNISKLVKDNPSDLLS
ncbi:MAG: DUF6282 family protein [SAR202 cluster bacterium]|nr:DUF6282 family protein [SAR202 cluster bacterium]